MKNLLFICLILFACEKNTPEPEFCWTCYKNTKSGTSSTSIQVDLCGQTEAEIKQIIDDNTFTGSDLQKWMECYKKN